MTKTKQNKTSLGLKDFWKFKREICERTTECKRPKTENKLPKSLTANLCVFREEPSGTIPKQIEIREEISLER